MDELVFPLLTSEEDASVSEGPWTPEIGRTMEKLAKKYVNVKPSEPVFGTIVFDCDLILYLHINDELLRRRASLRKGSYEDAKNMQAQIEENIVRSGIPVIEIMV